MRPATSATRFALRWKMIIGVIVGDTIFEGGPGKTWSPEGFQTTLTTLRKVVLPWPDETVCYPGHGPSFRLGDQRPVN